MEIESHPRLTLEQRRLLGGWRDVADDVQRLGAALQDIPDGCGCATGPAHLKGTCSCCQRGDGREECVDCEVLVHSLAWRVDRLVEDTSRYMPAVDRLLSRVWRADGEACVHDIRQRIDRVAQSMARLESAAHQFATGCNLDQLRELRSHATELEAHVGELGDQLIPRAPGPTRYSV